MCVDICSTYAVVVPIRSKSEGDIATGLIEAIHNMGKKPKMIMTDDEGSLKTNSIQDYLKNNNICHYVTQSHPHFAERFIRTLKVALRKRIEHSREDNPQWIHFLFERILP